MIFLSLLVVLMLVQWWGSGAPLQHDRWFLNWLDWLQSRRFIRAISGAHLLLGILLPCAVLALLVAFVADFLSPNWLFFVYVPVLLYSLGRGNFSAEVNAYISASERGDNVMATRLSDNMRGGAEQVGDELQLESWPELHEQTLRIISYRGFERMFAVLFWFFILGAVGALMYRLSVIYRERASIETDQKLGIKWLWLLEWPVVRLMGLTWAMVGNFESCYRCWQNRLMDISRSSMAFLNTSLRGALGVDDLLTETDVGVSDLSAASQPTATQSTARQTAVGQGEPGYSLSLIKAAMPLFSRSLLLWVCIIALVTLLV